MSSRPPQRVRGGYYAAHLNIWGQSCSLIMFSNHVLQSCSLIMFSNHVLQQCSTKDRAYNGENHVLERAQVQRRSYASLHHMTLPSYSCTS